MEENEEFSLTACTSTYVAMCMGGGLPWLLWFITLFVPGHRSNFVEEIKLLSVLALMFFLSYFWVKGFRITVTSDELIYRDGYYRTKRMMLSEIKSSKIRSIRFSRFSRFPLPCLVITPKDGSSAPIVINIKPFSQEDLEALFSFLKMDEKRDGFRHRKLFGKKSKW